MLERERQGQDTKWLCSRSFGLFSVVLVSSVLFKGLGGNVEIPTITCYKHLVYLALAI